MEAGRHPSPAPSNPESDEKQRKRGQYENKKNNLLRFQSNHPPPAPNQNDARDYGIGAQVLYDLGLRRVRFLTNNPKKRVGMEGYGLTVVEQVPITASPNPHNIRYLRTKRDKMGHTTLLASEETRDAESA